MTNLEGVYQGLELVEQVHRGDSVVLHALNNPSHDHLMMMDHSNHSKSVEKMTSLDHFVFVYDDTFGGAVRFVLIAKVPDANHSLNRSVLRVQPVTNEVSEHLVVMHEQFLLFE